MLTKNMLRVGELYKHQSFGDCRFTDDCYQLEKTNSNPASAFIYSYYWERIVEINLQLLSP